MRNLKMLEAGLVFGGDGNPAPPPPPGVTQVEWDALIRELEQQESEDAQKQH